MTVPGADPLLEGLKVGDERAYANVYDRFGPALYRTALGWLHDGSDAEDAVQDVFLGLVRSRRKLAVVHDLTAYLFASLRHAAGRIARARAARRALASALESAPLRSSSPTGSSEELERALLALPPAQRQVVLLKLEGGLTFAEIGRVLGVSLHTAASRYRYALEKLRGLLGDARNA